MRIPAATAADLAIWLLLFVMTRPGGVPENYKPVAAVASLTLCGLLFLIYQAALSGERWCSGIPLRRLRRANPWPSSGWRRAERWRSLRAALRR
jgi:hypothetical protein